MESVTETTAYKGLTKAFGITMSAHGKQLASQSYNLTNHRLIIRTADQLLAIRRNYVNNQEATK